MSNRVYKFETLLKTLASKPMNREEITKFLISRSGGMLSYSTSWDAYNSSLYGTTTRVGLLERFCRRNNDGRYQTIRKVARPFTPVRWGATDDTYLQNTQAI